MSNWRSRLHERDLSSAELRAIFVEALTEARPLAAVHLDTTDPVRLEVETSKGKRVGMDLATYVADAVIATAAERARLMDQRVAAAVEAMRSADGELPADTLTDLVPTIKSLDWLNGMPVNDLASSPIAADLAVVYAFDRGSSFAYARWPVVDAFGRARGELPAITADNLRARLPKHLQTRGDGKSFTFIAGGNFEASLLVLGDLWDQLGRSMPGTIVACPVTRDVLLVSSTGTPGGVDSLSAARDRLTSGAPPANFISTTLLERRDGGWAAFRPN